MTTTETLTTYTARILAGTFVDGEGWAGERIYHIWAEDTYTTAAEAAAAAEAEIAAALEICEEYGDTSASFEYEVTAA